MKPAESIRLWQRVVEVYTHRLRENPAAAECLRALNIRDPQVLEHFQAGYSDGTLPALLPKSGEAVEALRALGLLDSAGKETLTGCVMLPVFDRSAMIQGFCGIRCSDESMPTEFVVPSTAKGFLRGAILRDGSPLFLANRAMDAFALWQAGFRNVIVLVGFHEDDAELAANQPVGGHEVVYLCGSQMSPKAVPEGWRHPVVVVPWPPEVSGAAEYFQKRTRDDFQDLLATLTRPVGGASPLDPHSITENPDGLDIRCSGRCYELRAITKPGPDRLRATVKALGEHGRFVIDTVDFYHARTRRSFLCEAARLWRQPLEAMEADLNRLTAELEGYVERRARPAARCPIPCRC